MAAATTAKRIIFTGGSGKGAFPLTILSNLKGSYTAQLVAIAYHTSWIKATKCSTLISCPYRILRSTL